MLLTKEVVGLRHANLSNRYWEAAQINSEYSSMDLIRLRSLFPQHCK